MFRKYAKYDTEFIEICSENMPEFIKELIQQCWNDDQLKRPTAKDLHEKFNQWYFNDLYNSDSEIRKQIEEVDEFNEKQPTLTNSSNDTELTYTTHPQAIYTSRLLNFKNLPEPKNADDGEPDYFGNYYNLNT